MPSMVLVGDLESHWGPPVAFGGPQMASNTCVATNGSRTVRGNGSADVGVRPLHLRGVLSTVYPVDCCRP